VALKEVAGVDDAVLNDVVVALTVAECLEFDSVLAGVGSGVWVAGGVLGVVGSVDCPAVGSLDFGSVSTGLAVPVCAPPLLLTMTPEPTSVLDDVAPDVVVVPDAVVAPDAVVPALVDVGPLLDVEPPPVVVAEAASAVVADPVDSLVDVELDVLGDDSEDVPVVSAPATP
jgi:hypothetical protein